MDRGTRSAITQVVLIGSVLTIITSLCSVGCSRSNPTSAVTSTDFRPINSAIARTLFGLNIHVRVLQKQSWPTIPFGSLRLWDSATGWAQLNPAKGEYDWSTLDQWLSAVNQHPNQVNDVLYTFGRTPVFASSEPGRDCAYGPGECAPPSDVAADGGGTDQYWKDFVTAIVTHSKNSPAGHIKYWELWNEPYGLDMWAGTISQLTRMARDAYSIIKTIDPDAVVLAPCVGINVPVGNKFLNWYEAYLSAGGGDYADVMTIHGYVHYGGKQPGAQAFLNYYHQARDIMVRHGVTSKPVWDTEGSWGDSRGNHFEDEGQQAAFTAQLYLLHWSVGVQRLYWYGYDGKGSDNIGALWVEDSEDGKSGHLTKAGKAYAQAQEWLVGATLSEPCQQDGSRFICNLTRNGHAGQIVWDTAGDNPYRPRGAFRNQTDLDGNRRSAEEKVNVGFKPVLLEAQ